MYYTMVGGRIVVVVVVRTEFVELIQIVILAVVVEFVEAIQIVILVAEEALRIAILAAMSVEHVGIVIVAYMSVVAAKASH